jgi:integrase
LEVVVPHLADKPIASITEHDIEKWWSEDSKRCPTQTSKVYSHLKSVFAYAQKKKIIRENPCDIEGASKYVPEKQPEIPTRSQVDIFLENSSPEFALIIALASMGGLRKHEILDLRKGDIIKEEIAGEVYYSVSITKGVSWVNGVPVSRIPKTVKSIRRVELPQAINRYLAKHLTQVAIHDEALLFPTSPLTPEIHFSKHQLQRTWEKIRAVAGYRGRFHSLRGYALTRYAQAGATTQELMDLGGHSDFKIALSYQRSTGRQRELISNW